MVFTASAGLLWSLGVFLTQVSCRPGPCELVMRCYSDTIKFRALGFPWAPLSAWLRRGVRDLLLMEQKEAVLGRTAPRWLPGLTTTIAVTLEEIT